MPGASKLKIGLVFDGSLDSNDGVAQYVKTLGSWLSRQGHAVSYLVGQSKSTEWAGDPVYSLAKNLKVKWAGNRVSMPIKADKAAIKQLLSMQTFDILHVQVPYSPLMAKKAIKQAPWTTTVIGTFHILPAGRLGAIATKLLTVLYGISLKRFSRMMAVTAAAADFARWAMHLPVTVQPNVVELSRFRSPKPVKNQANHIVFLGRLVERKGAGELLVAFKQLQSLKPDASLTIAGDGPLRPELENYVQKNGLANKVKFTGFIDEAEKPKLLASADIACFPALYGESFGIVLIEAMAAGAGVVIGGNNPGYASVLGEKPPLLFNPRDSRELTTRLKQLLSNRGLHKELHTWQQTYVERFDVQVVGPQVVKLYREAIAKRT